MHIWVPTYFYPIAERMLPKDKQRIILRDYTLLKKKFNAALQARAFSVHKYTNLAAHMTEHAFEVINYTQVEDKFKNYLTFNVDDVDVSKFNLPKKYVVIPPNFTSKTRVFLGQHINKIVDHCKSLGYEVVFLGNSKTETGVKSVILSDIDPETDLSKGINLINQTTILEVAKILKESSLVIGLDNGLLHLAACFDTTKIIYGFTSVLPEHRLPYRKNIKGWNVWPVVVNSKELECIGCQSNCTYTYSHTFTKCYYDDYKCLFMLSADKYIEKINEALKNEI